MAIAADFSERAECSSAPEGEPAPRVDPIDELMRIVGENAEPPPRRAKAAGPALRVAMW